MAPHREAPVGVLDALAQQQLVLRLAAVGAPQRGHQLGLVRVARDVQVLGVAGEAVAGPGEVAFFAC